MRITIYWLKTYLQLSKKLLKALKIKSALLKTQNQTQACCLPQPPKNEFFPLAMYQKSNPVEGIEAKLKHYIKEDPKPEGTKIVTYWASCQISCPKLSKMACQYLSIPETSAALEQLFSKGIKILSWW